MTLAIHEDTNGALVLRQEPATLATRTADTITRLTDWAQEARAAAAIAASLVKTSFVPEAFRGKPEEATAAILTGFEMGLSPMAALRAIYVIKGTPAMYAKTMRAIVQSHGHEIWTENATATRAIVKGRRKGSDKVETSTWTVDRARTAGLLSNQQYTKNPQNMLTARATAEVCWLVASDALHGIACAVEELDDDNIPTDAGVPDQVPAQSTRRAARRQPLESAPATEPEPEAPGAPPTEVRPTEPAPDVSAERTPMSRAQQSKMHALFNKVGITDRGERMQYVNEILADKVGPERQVESSTELDSAETDHVIDALERWAAQLDGPADVEVVA